MRQAHISRKRLLALVDGIVEDQHLDPEPEEVEEIDFDHDDDEAVDDRWAR